MRYICGVELALIGSRLGLTNRAVDLTLYERTYYEVGIMFILNISSYRSYFKWL